jgi:hypothetical protein
MMRWIGHGAHVGKKRNSCRSLVRKPEGICRHNTEYSYNNKYNGTSNVILAKHWLWLPDDGLCKPKHVGAAFVILIVLII